MERVGSSCVWTDEEVGVLLNITLQYKRSKEKEDMDWEACKYKYSDITTIFHEALSRKQKSKDFPRIKGETTKAQLTSKLKNIRGKFMQAVESGRRSGYGRTVLIYYELCNKIWGGGDMELIRGFPRTPALDCGVETVDFNGGGGEGEVVKVEPLSPPVSPGPGHGPGPESPREPESEPEPEPASPSANSRPRRKQLRLQKAPPPVNGHVRLGPLKRRAARDIAQEDLEIKHSMLQLLRTQVQRADERMERLVSSMETLVNAITQTHAQLQGQSQCTCNTRPPQAGESNSSAVSGTETKITDTTLKVKDTFSLVVKKESENTEVD